MLGIGSIDSAWTLDPEQEEKLYICSPMVSDFGASLRIYIDELRKCDSPAKLRDSSLTEKTRMIPAKQERIPIVKI